MRPPRCEKRWRRSGLEGRRSRDACSAETRAGGEHPGGVAMTVRHEIAWLSLLIGSVVVVTPAHATDHPARGLPPHAGAAPTRNELYAAVRAYEANVGTHALAAAIPAFARKYGMKCSACHLAVPVLNQFGQAFKDNGYRMKNGT